MSRELGINDIREVVSVRNASLHVLSILQLDNPIAFRGISLTASNVYPDSIDKQLARRRQAYYAGVACGVVGVAIARNPKSDRVSLGFYPVITEKDLVKYDQLIAGYYGIHTEIAYAQFMTGFKKILPRACELVESYSMLGVNAYPEHALSWMFGAVVSLGMARANLTKNIS